MMVVVALVVVTAARQVYLVPDALRLDACPPSGPLLNLLRRRGHLQPPLLPLLLEMVPHQLHFLFSFPGHPLPLQDPQVWSAQCAAETQGRPRW